jgi:transcriptional regulator with XRE-family HTH domain
MIRRSSPTVRGRELGALLKAFREERDLTAAQVAEDVGISPAVLSRLETAARSSPRSGPPHVRALCSYYRLDASTTERLVRLAKEAAEPGWWQRYNLESPTATYLDLESAAVSIETFEAMVVPGLLQTRDYAKEVIEPVRADFSTDQLRETIESRVARQRVLTGENPLVFHAVIDEAVVSRVFGDRDVMRAQLQHIRQVSTDLPNVTVQVLPFSRGANPGVDGTFAVLNFAEDLLPSVVYVEGQLGQVFEDEPDEVKRVKKAFSGLSKLALDPEQTLAVIDKRIRDLT